MATLSRRVANRVRLLARRPSPRHIVALTYAMTYRCNSRCRHCGIWEDQANRGQVPYDELTADEIDTIWTRNASYFTQLQSVHLTGGEPFLRGDVSDICNQALRRFPSARIHISTNGLTGDRIVRSLGQVHAPERVCLAFSLDGTGEVYAAMRGVDRFDEVLDVVRRVRAAYPQIAVGLNVTVMPGTVASLKAIRDVAAEVGAGFGMQVAHTSAFYHNAGQQWPLRPEVLDQVAGVADEMVRDYRRTQGLLKSLVDVDPYYYAHLASRATATLPRPASQPCYSGTHSLFLNPYGFVFPCVILSAPMGRLPQQSLDEFWHEPAACATRKGIAKGDCQCWTSCEAFPSLSRDPRVIAWNIRSLWRR